MRHDARRLKRDIFVYSYKKVVSFRGRCPLTPTGVLPLDPARGPQRPPWTAQLIFQTFHFPLFIPGFMLCFMMTRLALYTTFKFLKNEIIKYTVSCILSFRLPAEQPQWGTADAEIKNPLVGARGYQMFPLFKPGVGI